MNSFDWKLRPHFLTRVASRAWTEVLRNVWVKFTLQSVTKIMFRQFAQDFVSHRQSWLTFTVYLSWRTAMSFHSVSSVSAVIRVKDLKLKLLYTFFFFLWRCGPTWAMASSFLRFLDHTQPRTTVGRTLLDEWTARRRDFYLTTHNIYNR